MPPMTSLFQIGVRQIPDAVATTIPPRKGRMRIGRRNPGTRETAYCDVIVTSLLSRQWEDGRSGTLGCFRNAQHTGWYVTHTESAEGYRM